MSSGSRAGSILLPVIAVLMLIASAATVMTLQAGTSLREAAIRRDRFALGFMADAGVRAVASALQQALADRRAVPFRLDGTPQRCGLPAGGRLVLAVQDEAGLVDLNKASPALVTLVLQRAGLSGWDAKAATDAIERRRTGNRPPFGTPADLDGLTGLPPDALDHLIPLFTVASGSSGLDATVAGPELRALIPARELGGPAMADVAAPSTRTAFTITGLAVSRVGTRVERRALVKIAPATPSEVQFSTWDAPVSLGSLDGIGPGAFCARLAAALAASD